MTDAKRSEQVTRDAILNMLTDEETARVSTAEVATGLNEGAEYLDSEQLGQGVQRARAGTAVTVGHVLPRSVISEQTWSKILARLAR